MSPLSFAVVATLVFVVTALPVAPVDKLNTAARVANFDDVSHVFTSALKGTEGCPDEVVIKSIDVDLARNIGNVMLKDITVDGAYCTGKGTSKMSLVSEATTKAGDLLKRLGFPKAYYSLQKTSPARAVVNNARADSSLLVGFDEGSTTCGSYSQTEEAFWFFIREAADFRILLRKTKKEHVSMNIPSNVRALFIADGFGKLCLLYDKKSAGAKSIGILSYDPKDPAPVPVPPVAYTPAPKKPKSRSSDDSKSDGTGSDNSHGTDADTQDDSDTNKTDGTGSDNSHGTDSKSNDGSDSPKSDDTDSDNSQGTDNKSDDNSDKSDSGKDKLKTVARMGKKGKKKGGSDSDGTDTDTDGKTDHDGRDNTDSNTDGSDGKSDSGADKPKRKGKKYVPTVPKAKGKYYYKPKKSGRKGKKKGGSDSDHTDTDTDGNTDHDGRDKTDDKTDDGKKKRNRS